MSRLTFEDMLEKEDVVKIKRSDFVVLHNKSMEALIQLSKATSTKRGMTAEETLRVFQEIYPVVKGLQDMAVKNNFSLCL